MITDKKNEIFLNSWNLLEREKDRIYISYDSSNMNTSSVGIQLAEYGHPKVDENLPQVNLSLAINQEETLPLFYELYPGSNIDNSQLKHMVDRLSEYGYRDIGVILDRGYYSRYNINYLKEKGYDYLLMVKTNNDVIAKMIKENRYVLPKAKYFIDGHNVYGMTKQMKLFVSDSHTSYVHLYFDYERSASETTDLNARQKVLSKELDRYIKEHTKKEDLKKKYPSFRLKADKDGYLVSYTSNDRYIDDLSDTFGFFAIVTSKKMDAGKALDIYRDRDSVEKLFEVLKTEMDYNRFRVSSTSSLRGKTFIIFIASIIRSRIYYQTRSLKQKNRKDYTVPAIINELSNIEASRNAKDIYVRRYSLTSRQKTILSQFGLTEKDIDSAIERLNSSMISKQKNNQKNNQDNNQKHSNND